MLKDIMDKLQDQVALPVHDCVILYQRDKNNVIGQMYRSFSQYLKVEHEQFPKYAKQREQEQLSEHEKFIKQQEQLAQQYADRKTKAV